jgi:hypothetical protein
MNDVVVLWQNQPVGTMQNPRPDMWYLEGQWLAHAGPLTPEFEAICRDLTPEDFFAGKAPGIEVTLTDQPGSYQQAALVVCLLDGRLSVRRIVG